MTTTKLSHAIKLILAAQVGATMLVSGHDANAQQMPVAVQPQAVMAQPGITTYPQGAYAVQQPAFQAAQQQMVYAQPQGAYVVQQPQQPMVYQQPQQMVYQQQAPQQMVYAQPQAPMYRQPVMQAPQLMMRPAAPVQQAPMYPQGAVLYPQGAVMQQSGVQYGNVMMQQAPPVYQTAMTPQGTVVYQQGGAPLQQAPMMVYPNGMPVQQGAVYGYSGQVPQGAVMYPNGVIMQPAAPNGMAAGAVVTDPANELRADEPRLQTGSAGKLNTSPSNIPVQTLTGDQLRQVNAVNVESALNSLPQVIAGADRTTNDSRAGRATADLRGLGPNRTAVLLNGRPFVPATASGNVDLNAIPQALVKQVDVTTGGASVAYGSGAMAGAVNFVLDENYQGVELNVSHQGTPDREAGISSADLTLGTDFAEGRGNFAISIGGSEREGLEQGARDFGAFAQFDGQDVNGNPTLMNGGSTGVPGTAIFSGSLSDFSPTAGVTFDQNGQIRPFETGEDNDFFNYAPVNYIQLPQTREHATAIARFEVAESAELYGLGMYSATETQRQGGAVPIFVSGSEFTIDGSPFLTTDSQQVLSQAFGSGVDTDGDGIDDTGSAFLRRRMLESGNNTTTLNSVSEYVQGGLRGRIGSGLEYDVYASRGNVESVSTHAGNINRDRFKQALLLDLEADPNGTVCQDPDSDSTSVACTPANIFGPGNVSEGAAEFLAVGFAVESEYEQSTAGARLTAKIGDLPGGAARFTVGAERREDRYEQEFVPGDDSSNGSIVGFNAIQSYGGDTSSESLYGDIYLPLATNTAGAELLDLELGYRVTEHSTAGEAISYGAAMSWAPTEFLSVRASYNQANRAPSIVELYTPETMGVAGASDPCSAAGSSGFLSPEQVAQCIATGVPAELVGTSAINLPSGQVQTLSGGNLDLEAEQAETFSAGLAIALPVGERATVRLGGDYFSISGSNAVAPFGGGAANVLGNCYDPNASSELSGSYCSLISRNDMGVIESVELKAQNESFFEVEGVDLFAGVSLPVMGGTLGLDFNGTILDTHNFTAVAGLDAVECAGRFGNNCGQVLPEYSHRVTAGWTTDNLTAAVIWRHVGEVEDDDDSLTFVTEKIGARDYLDAELSLDFANSIGLAVGVQNLTDVAPPVLGDNQGQANTYPTTYDVFGRTYFVRLTGSSSLD